MASTGSAGGVYKNFPKVKTFLKVYLLGHTEWRQEVVPMLERYSREPGFKYVNSPEFAAYPHTYDFFSAEEDLAKMSRVKKWFAIHGALAGEPGWFEVWRQAVAYAQWAERMKIRMSEDSHQEVLDGKRKSSFPDLFLANIGPVIGDCIALGWLDEAEHLASMTRTALDREARGPYEVFNDAGDRFGLRRTQHFILRLVADWKGWAPPTGPKCAFDEPLFNALIEKWRTTDLDELAALLAAACDRHTHQSRMDAFSRNAFYDMRDWELWYDPFEVLSVLRLRDSLGLPNPQVRHPLLDTPLGVLPPVTPLYSDELLEGVLEQARKERPAF